MNESIRTYLSAIGTKGGKAGTGKSKARTHSQAKNAARARWQNKKKLPPHPRRIGGGLLEESPNRGNK